jgi:hypothetical protein
MAHRQAFDLGKLTEKSHPKAARRLVPDESDEVRGNQIVAIELFFNRAVLLGEINGRTNRGHQHQVVGIPRDADRD